MTKGIRPDDDTPWRVGHTVLPGEINTLPAGTMLEVVDHQYSSRGLTRVVAMPDQGAIEESAYLAVKND
jgi:hypothetical protein